MTHANRTAGAREQGALLGEEVGMTGKEGTGRAEASLHVGVGPKVLYA